MSAALAPSLTPLQIHEDLHRFLLYVEEQLAAANQYSVETFQRLKDRLADRSIEWQGIAQRARGLLGSLPREIVQRNISEELRQTLERCEQQARVWYEKVSWEDLVQSLQKFRLQAKELSLNLGSLQSHPLFQNFLQGQRVLPSRTQLQWGRKLFHVMTGLFGLWFYGYSGVNATIVTWVLVACFTGAATTEVLRRFSPSINRRICNRMHGIMRERERHKISSATYFMGAMLAIFLIFPKDVNLLALYFTSVGDAAAGIVGSRWGRHRLAPHVSLEGTLAAFGICFLGCLFLAAYGLPNYHPQGVDLWLFSFGAATVATVAESCFKRFDDNLTVPLLSAPALWLLTWLF
jgi:dolichol kinase